MDVNFLVYSILQQMFNFCCNLQQIYNFLVYFTKTRYQIFGPFYNRCAKFWSILQRMSNFVGPFYNRLNLLSIWQKKDIKLMVHFATEVQFFGPFYNRGLIFLSILQKQNIKFFVYLTKTRYQICGLFYNRVPSFWSILQKRSNFVVIVKLYSYWLVSL